MLISVIISTYNEFKSKKLQKAVKSVLKQTFQNWELIIVGDKTPFKHQIKKFLKKNNDPRICFINLKKRAGIESPGTIPKIQAIKKSKGKLLTFLDADNIYFPEHLKNCVTAFQAEPNLDLVYGNTIIKLSPNLSFKWRKPNWNKKRAKIIQHSNFLDMSECVFTRQAYQAAGGLNARHHASDWLLWKAMINAGHYNFKHLDHFGLIYHTTNLKHFLMYWGLMWLQKLEINYHSERWQKIQKIIKKRFQKKYQ